MAKSKKSENTDTPKEAPAAELTPMAPSPANIIADIPKPARVWLKDDIFDPLEDAAQELDESAEDALKTATQNHNGREKLYNKAEASVDVYENVLTKNANLLTKTMDKVAAEVSENVARATAIAKSIGAANVAIKGVKDKLAAADAAGEDLWDSVRRDMKDDDEVVKLRTKVGRSDGKYKLYENLEAYAREIQATSDHMNVALTEIAKANQAISTAKLQEVAKRAKTKTDAYKAEILTNLEFSKEKLRQTYADFLAFSSALSEAKYNKGATADRLAVFPKIKASLNKLFESESEQ